MKNKGPRLFIGIFPEGISYCDRWVEEHGDYKKIAFLPFRTLDLEWYATKLPPDVKERIEKDATAMQARRGEAYEISSSGQTRILGQ